MSKLKYNKQQATITEGNKQNSGCFASHSIECAKSSKENPSSDEFLEDCNVVCSAVEHYNQEKDQKKLVYSTPAKTKLTKLAPKTIALKRSVR